MSNYRVRVTRDKRFWLVEVEGVGFTQARNLREVAAMARDLIAVMTSADPVEPDMEIEVELPDRIESHLIRSAELRRSTAEAQTDAAAEVRAAARLMREEGIPLRDIGQALGVSHQRAHQLTTK